MASYTSDIYFYKLLSQRTSGIIQMVIPLVTEGDSSRPFPLRALLEDNIRIKTENKWGTLVPSLDSLSQVSQLLNNANIISWVNGSSAAWESTAPIDIQFQMRLITFDSNSNILKQMVYLQSLESLYVTGALDVKVHGGYRNNFWTSNNGNPAWSMDGAKEQGGKLGQTINKGLPENGTVAIKFGNLTISNLLVNSVSAQISKVLCKNGQPLWIKLDVSLRGVKALLTQDLDNMIPDGDLTSGVGIGEAQPKSFEEEHPVIDKTLKLFGVDVNNPLSVSSFMVDMITPFGLTKRMLVDVPKYMVETINNNNNNTENQGNK